MSEKITVVVSVYNMEKYLEKCMKSLLEQTYQDYEIILIDDGSTDSSPQLCEDYAVRYSKRVKYIHKENGGLSSARNFGIEVARGKYIVFPDPDDWVEPDYLQRLIEVQKKYPEALVCCGYVIEFEGKENAVIENRTTKLYNRDKAQLHLLKNPRINGFAWNKLYDLQHIRKYNLKFLDDVGTKEDLDFAFRYISEVNQVVYAAEFVTYHYLQRDGSATWSGYSQKQFDGLRVYEKMIMDCQKNEELIQQAKAAICSSSINLMVKYLNSNVRDDKVWKALKSYIKENWIEYFTDNATNIKRKIMTIIAIGCPKILKFMH